MKELVVISGKGGTGKTSVVASFATLAQNKVLADCDVDAADLHLILQPDIEQRHPFTAGRQALIRQDDCIRCGGCLAHCRFRAVRKNGQHAGQATLTIDPIACEGCGVCVQMCPLNAIDFPETHCGHWFISSTRHGQLVHAQLAIAAENSGKLVTIVRQQAAQLARQQNLDLVIIDGAPGIGCPVIACLTGASLALIVTEPTVSGLHDLERVAQLAKQIRVPTAVCINKHDINPDLTARIQQTCNTQGIPVVGAIDYDPVVTHAQTAGQSVVEHSHNGIATQLRTLWQNTNQLLHQPRTADIHT